MYTLTRIRSLFALVAGVLFLNVALAASTGPTAAEIKLLLHSPLALLIVAMVAWALHGKKQTVVAARQGTSRMTFIDWISYKKETWTSLGLIVFGWLSMIALDQITDEAPLGIMFLAAVGLGIAPTQLTDLIDKKGRTGDLANAPTRPTPPQE